ncbi:MAG: DUF6132 family protein [Paludibacteraceae bacterium]|nr:DUF6132 family protein [Paludibacteraceae bacterium]
MKNKILDFLKKHRITIIGIVVGAIGGYAYWHFIGCASGTCPITGNPYISTAYGAVLGLLVFNSVKPKQK